MAKEAPARVAHLCALLEESSEDGDDQAVAIAIASERLRRDILAADHPDKATLLERAQKRLVTDWRGLNFDELNTRLGETQSGLELQIADSEGALEEIEDALWAIDEVLCVAVASARIGALKATDVLRLGERARLWAESNASRYSVLWELADELEMQLDGDDDYPGAYLWTHPLANHSAGMQGFGELVRSLKRS